MNKKLIAVAVGSALTMGAAGMTTANAADVKLYGKIYAELASEKTTGGPSYVTQDDNGGTSRIGIMVTDKLGNGMTAFGRVEYGFDVSGGNGAGQKNDLGKSTTSGLSHRLGYVGVKGGWGSVLAGSNDSIYKTTGGVKYDAFVATSLQARGAGGMCGVGAFCHGSYLDHMVEYDSPKMNGLQFKVQYVFAHQGGTPTTVTDSNGDTYTIGGTGVDGKGYNVNAAALGNSSQGDYSWGLSYDNGPLNLGVAGSHNKNPGASSENNWKLAGAYKMGDWRFLGQYEHVQSGVEGRYLFGAVQYKMGNNRLVGQIGQFNPKAGGVKNTNYYALGVQHFLSKTSHINFGYRNTKNKQTNVKSRALALGLQVDF